MQRRSMVMIGILCSTLAAAGVSAGPATVTVAGNFQSELGCSGDWQPDCTTTDLTLDPSGVWRRAFAVPAGSWEYKVAIDHAWVENYGAHAQPDGPNLTLALAAPAAVVFYYDPVTH